MFSKAGTAGRCPVCSGPEEPGMAWHGKAGGAWVGAVRQSPDRIGMAGLVRRIQARHVPACSGVAWQAWQGWVLPVPSRPGVA